MKCPHHGKPVSVNYQSIFKKNILKGKYPNKWKVNFKPCNIQKMRVIDLYFRMGCIIILMLTSCQSTKNGNLTDSEKGKITQEIESLVDHFFSPANMNYVNHVDLRANKEGYVYAGDGKIQYADYESYRSSVEAIFKNIKQFTEVKRTRTFIYVLSRDAATCTVEFESKFLKTNNETVVHNGCWTMVFKKFEEGWKVIQENGTHTK